MIGRCFLGGFWAVVGVSPERAISEQEEGRREEGFGEYAELIYTRMSRVQGNSEQGSESELRKSGGTPWRM